MTPLLDGLGVRLLAGRGTKEETEPTLDFATLVAPDAREEAGEGEALSGSLEPPDAELEPEAFPTPALPLALVLSRPRSPAEGATAGLVPEPHRAPVAPQSPDVRTTRRDYAQPEPAQLEPAQPEPARSEPMRFEPARFESVRSEPVRSQPGKGEAAAPRETAPIPDARIVPAPLPPTARPTVAAPATIVTSAAEPLEATPIPRRLDLVLTPERLGTVRVTVRLVGAEAQVRIVASTEAGFAALDADRDALLPLLRDIRSGHTELRVTLQTDPASPAPASETWTAERHQDRSWERGSRHEREPQPREPQAREDRPRDGWSRGERREPRHRRDRGDTL